MLLQKQNNILRDGINRNMTCRMHEITFLALLCCDKVLSHSTVSSLVQCTSENVDKSEKVQRR